MSKTILLTGATDGIGLETAKMLAAGGHTLLLHGRSEAKLNAALAEVGGTTTGYLADFSDLDAVRNMAEEIKANHPTIDVIINNAGVLKTPNTRTASGFDVRFVVNTFAPVVLTDALLSHMPNDGRVINLSSAAQAPVSLSALRGEGQLDDMGAYAQSKLALTMWSAGLAEELANGPMVLAVNPGSLLASKMVKEGFGVAGHDLSIGTNLLVATATSPDFATATGKYFDNDAGRFGPPHGDALDVQKRASVVAAIREILA